MLSKVVTQFIKKAGVDRRIAVALDKDLGDIALLTETAIKNRTPVVTGRLKASMVARKEDFLKYEVATNVEYAPYVEYGTSRFSGRAMMRRGAADIKKGGARLLKRSLNVK